VEYPITLPCCRCGLLIQFSQGDLTANSAAIRAGNCKRTCSTPTRSRNRATCNAAHVAPHRATLLLQNGVDVRVVQEFFGYALIATTQRRKPRASWSERAGFGRQARFKWITLEHEGKRRFRESHLFFLRPRRDLNPCYRRESTRPSRLYRNLEGAGGAVRPLKLRRKSLSLHEGYMDPANFRRPLSSEFRVRTRSRQLRF
jgi:hypothetical protein